MASARITQETVEVLAADSGLARITQEVAEVLGPVHSTARITQQYLEVLAPATPLDARITQLYNEVLGPPVSGGHNARITQEYAEVLGAPIDEAPCQLPAPIICYGNVSGPFYSMKSMGAETIPVALADSTVTLEWGSNTGHTQTLSAEETWFTWAPLSGGLLVSFSSGNPVRTLWVVTSQARATPPIISVWASAFRFDLWKQECMP